MGKKFIVLSLLLLCCIAALAQHKQIRFEYEVLSLPATTMYVESVIYTQLNKSCVGTFMHDNKIDSIDLKDGINTAFFNYLKFNLPQNNAGPAIMLKITKINVNEVKTSAFDSLHILLVLEFYKADSVGFSKIYTAEYNNNISNRAGIKGYESMIRVGLTKCLVDFIATKALAKTTTTNHDGINTGPEYKAISTNKIPKEILFTGSFMQGTNANGFDISLYRWPEADSGGWRFPGTIFFENLTINPSAFDHSGYLADKINYGLIGVSVFKNLSTSIYLNLSGLMIIGSEELTDTFEFTSYNLVVGGEATEGIYYVSKAQFGVVFGIAAYEKVLNSVIYKNDIGFKIEAGLKL
ncbi:MAG TPA: hypothetical protein VK806_07790 [Bacteroidia bacterium]|jgi:hypothetical protein|nr:hypothetical protein [Bacteroidia bacterium]